MLTHLELTLSSSKWLSGHPYQSPLCPHWPAVTPHSSGPGPRPREPGMHVLQPLCEVPLCSVPEQTLEGAGLVGACPMCDPTAPRDVSASQAAHARQHGAWVSVGSLTASFTVKWLTRWVHSPRRTSQQSLAVGRCLL